MATRKKATTERHYPVPANYPVSLDLIPDMPVDLFHLHTTGRVLPSDCETYGWPVMKCATCEAATAMFLTYPPMAPEQIKKTRVIPGTVWGKDVAVICPCCSFSHCQHCQWHGEMRIGHTPDATGKCSRCGKANVKAAA